MDLSKNIAFEAYKLHEADISTSSEANWLKAENELSLFPSEKYSFQTTHDFLPEIRNGGFLTRHLAAGNKDYYKYNHCRELFDKIYLGTLYGRKSIYEGNRCFTDGFLFGYIKSGLANKTSLQVAKCIRDVEAKLGILELTKFQLVDAINNDYVKNNFDFLFIRPSSFWTKQHVRFGLFTIFLRTGLNYNGNLDAAIMVNNYASGTALAINYFMEGNVDCSKVPSNLDERRGWYNFFKVNSSPEQLKIYLTK